MFPPLVIAGWLAVASSVGLTAYQGYNEYQRYAENKRYWDDYKRNTGHSPRYPYRVGAYNDYSRLVTPIVSGINHVNAYYTNQQRMKQNQSRSDYYRAREQYYRRYL